MTQECSNHYPLLSNLRSKVLSRSKMKWWAIYINLPVNAIVRLPHPRRGDSQGQETFLGPSLTSKPTTMTQEYSNHHPSLSTLRSKGLSRSKIKWWTNYTHFPVNAIVRLAHPRSGDSQGQETFLTPPADKQTRNYDLTICFVVVVVVVVVVCN